MMPIVFFLPPDDEVPKPAGPCPDQSLFEGAASGGKSAPPQGVLVSGLGAFHGCCWAGKPPEFGPEPGAWPKPPAHAWGGSPGTPRFLSRPPCPAGQGSCPCQPDRATWVRSAPPASALLTICVL